MPLRRLLGEKDIMTDLRRINTGAGSGSGSVGQHSLLGPRHSDTATNAPSTGALIVGNATPKWSVLVHPEAAGYAMVTSATTWTIDQTPTWTGRHAWNDGSVDRAYVDEDGESVFRRTRTELQSSHFAMGESHGFGGTTYVAPCAGLRTAFTL